MEIKDFKVGQEVFIAYGYGISSGQKGTNGTVQKVGRSVLYVDAGYRKPLQFRKVVWDNRLVSEEECFKHVLYKTEKEFLDEEKKEEILLDTQNHLRSANNRKNISLEDALKIKEILRI